MASNYTPELGEGVVASSHRDESQVEEENGEVRTIQYSQLWRHQSQHGCPAASFPMTYEAIWSRELSYGKCRAL